RVRRLRAPRHGPKGVVQGRAGSYNRVRRPGAGSRLGVPVRLRSRRPSRTAAVLGDRLGMVERHYIFPGVIELNVQARRRLGVNVYLIDGGSEYALIDVGFLDELPEVLELIRQMDFSLSACKVILATHADVDHSHGLATARHV